MAVGGLVLALAVTDHRLSAGNEPAPLNPYNGMQQREEVYEFKQKPSVTKEAGKWVIRFESKAGCDATVWVESPEGRVIAHLGSGVLGKNAPFPFRQDSLVQEIEWDGTDDTGKPAPAGGDVKVGLGLKASYERLIAWDPCNLDASRGNPVRHVVFGDGTISVVTGSRVVLFDPAGKYLKTLAPHPADTPREKLTGFDWIKTAYGEEQVPVTIGRGWRKDFHHFAKRGASWSADPKEKRVIWTMPDREAGPQHYAIGVDGSFTKADGPGPAELVEGPGEIGEPTIAPEATYAAPPRICADPASDEVYVRWDGSHVCPTGIFRYDGKTGVLDKTWPDIGMAMMDVGPDGLIYARIGAYGKHVARFDRQGKVIGFPKNGVTPERGRYSLPKYLNEYADPFTVLSFGTGGSNVQQKGFAVSPSTGDIYVHIQYVDPQWAARHCKKWKEGQQLLAVFGPDGGLKSANALPGLPNAHGLGVDRWCNVYKGVKDVMPAGQELFDGLSEMPPGRPGWGEMVPAGSIVKFPGGALPVGALRSAEEDGPGVKLSGFRGGSGYLAEKALWAYGGYSPLGGSACTCSHSTFDVDPFGRAFLPQAYVHSVMVLDANGNKVLRIGRYGNADSRGPGSPVPEPEIGFVWVRGVSATDRALYAYDPGNRRILKAALEYHAEESVPLKEKP